MLPFREMVFADFEFMSAGQASGRPRFVQSLTNYAAVAASVFGRTRCWGQRHPGRTAPMSCLLPIMHPPSSASYRVLDWPTPDAGPRSLYRISKYDQRAADTPAGKGLLGALAYFGLDGVGATEKKEMQEAIGAGTWQGRFSQTRCSRLLSKAMWRHWSGCLLRCCRRLICRVHCCGAAIMAACAAIEHAGVPIDMDMLALLREGWTDIQDQLIAEIDRDLRRL